MAAPRIVPLHRVLAQRPGLVQGFDEAVGGLTADEVAFVVTDSGVFAGQWLDRGDVLVCAGGEAVGTPVVLVAHTRGRPRLGHRRAGGFTGDRGELCSAARWSSAGGVVALWTKVDGLAWQSAAVRMARACGPSLALSVTDRQGPARLSSPAWEEPGREDVSGDPSSEPQLGLFGAPAQACAA